MPIGRSPPLPHLSSNMQKHFTLTLGITLLLWLFSTLLCVVLAEWMHISMGRWMVPLGYAAAICIVSMWHIRRDGFNLRLLCQLLFTTITIAALSLLIGGYAYDYAYDGMSYHQPIIRSLLQGWNPMYEPHCSYTTEWACTSYVDHYPKALETLCAAFAAFAGDVECGKSVNLLLIIASFCFVISFLEVYFAHRYGQFTKLILALLLTLSPVTLSQVLTFYVDFALYAYLLMAFSCLYLYLHPDTSSSVSPTSAIGSRDFVTIVAMLVSLAIGTKVIAAFWMVVFFLTALIVVGVKKRKCAVRAIISGLMLGGLLGLFVFAYHPYISHLQQGLHMLHPFMGSEAVDIEALQTEALAESNRTEAVLKSLFSRPNDGTIDSAKGYLPCFQNIITSGKADVRLGGGGVLFIEMLLFTPLLLLLSWRSAPAATRCCAGIIIGLVAALFVLPNGWWIRFTPFTYAIPLCAFLHCLKHAPHRGRMIKRCTLVIITTNILIVGCVSLSLMQIHRSKVHYLTDVLKQSRTVHIHTENHTFIHQMQERGIEFHSVQGAPQQLIFPGPPVHCYLEEWNTRGLSITDYPLLRYSNISQNIVFPQ